MVSRRYVIYLSDHHQIVDVVSLGAADPATHKIYIWDMQNDGQFATALDGGREPLLHVHVRLGLFTSIVLTYFIRSGILSNLR